MTFFSNKLILTLFQFHSSHSPFSWSQENKTGKMQYFTIPMKTIFELIIKKLPKNQILQIMTRYFQKKSCEQIFCNFDVYTAHTAAPKPKKLENSKISQYQ